MSRARERMGHPKFVTIGMAIRLNRELTSVGISRAGFAEAAVEVKATYHAQVQTHVCLETHGHVAEWDGDNLTVWASTQAVFGTRQNLAQPF